MPKRRMACVWPPQNSIRRAGRVERAWIASATARAASGSLYPSLKAHRSPTSYPSRAIGKWCRRCLQSAYNDCAFLFLNSLASRS